MATKRVSAGTGPRSSRDPGVPAAKRKPRVAGQSRVPREDAPVAKTRRAPVVAPGASASLRKPDATKQAADGPATAAKIVRRPVKPAIELVKAQPRATGPVWLTWRLVAIVAAVALGLGVLATVAAWRPGARVTNTAIVANSETDEVRAAAANSLRTILATDVATIDKWPAAVRPLLTGHMQSDFDKTSAVTVQTVRQTRTKQDVQVSTVGVSLLDGNRAEVIAVVTVSVTGDDGVAGGSQRGGQRLRMEKVDGRWLLADVYEDCFRKGVISQECAAPR